jgi:hypothetical protein
MALWHTPAQPKHGRPVARPHPQVGRAPRGAAGPPRPGPVGCMARTDGPLIVPIRCILLQCCARPTHATTHANRLQLRRQLAYIYARLQSAALHPQRRVVLPCRVVTGEVPSPWGRRVGADLCRCSSIKVRQQARGLCDDSFWPCLSGL